MSRVNRAWRFVKETIEDMAINWRDAWMEFYNKCPITATCMSVSTIFFFVLSVVCNFMTHKGYSFKWSKE